MVGVVGSSDMVRWRVAVYWSLVVALVLALLPGSASADEHDGDGALFDDVPVGHVFFDEVAWLASSGIAAGWGDGSFRGNDPVTRGAVAAFLYRYEGEPEEADEDDAAITRFVGLDLERDLAAGTFTFSLVEDAAEFTSVIEIPDPLSSAGTVLVEDLTEASGELHIDGEPVSDAQFTDAVIFDDVIRYTPADADAGQGEAVIDLIDSRVRTIISKVLAGPDPLSFNLLVEPESTFTMTVADESDVDDVVFELAAAADGDLQSAAAPSRFDVIEDRSFEVELPGMALAEESARSVQRNDPYDVVSLHRSAVPPGPSGPSTPGPPAHAR